MATIRREVIIHRSVDDVWARVGDPADTPSWFPGMVSATVDGTSRVIVTGSGMRLPEEIVTIDQIARRFQYRVTLPFFEHHLGTIDVIAIGDGRTIVVYSTECKPDTLALVIGGAAGNALRELRRQMESPDGVV